jgi:hydroxymethylpyrimidine pyrophosphatase-like HAD family hydrolase
MRFEVLATDYDGTLAHDGRVEPVVLEALERLRASGRRVVLVTGREIGDLRRVFSRFELFDMIVAENGGVLFTPSTGQFKLLHPAPSPKLAQELRARNVAPLSVGHIIVATTEPNEAIVLEAIKSLGLELKIIFNKGSVMVLPPGVNKATGLAEALKQIGIAPEKTIGVGDAENDHAFLEFCGCAVAVNNALPSLKEHADWVTRNSDGRGVCELIEAMIGTDLNDVLAHRRLELVM